MKTLNTSRATYAEMAKIIFLASIVTYFLVLCAKKATAQENPRPITCTSFGRIVECKAGGELPKEALIWSAGKTEGENPQKNQKPYRSGGEVFNYKLPDNAEYTIELHVVNSSLQENRIFRYQVQWGKDPTDGVWKPLFKPPGVKSEASKTSPSTTKQASKEK